MDKGKSFHTKGTEQLKAHLPNLDAVEGIASKFWRLNWLVVLM